MLKGALLTTFLIVATAACATSASSPGAIRLDPTSDATTEESFAAMAKALEPEKRQELLLATIKLNFVGVESAYQAMQNPELKALSIARIKDQVGGMTAQEIIDLANRTSSVEAEVLGQ